MLPKGDKKDKKRVIKKKSVSYYKKKLWTIVSNYIRQRDGFVCFTSGVKVEGSNAHCGHGIPSSVGGVTLRYHPLNLHCQSYVENIHHSGNGGEYYRRQISKYGQEKVDRLYSLKNRTRKADTFFYQRLIDLYTNGDQDKIIRFLEN